MLHSTSKLLLLLLGIIFIFIDGCVGLPSKILSEFEKSCSVVLENGIEVDRYVSKRTGLRLVVGKVDGPMVSGYLTFATEAMSDDGLPHTLEHLVFLGSERYPYKGVLDLLANKCLASGTNAWTTVDSTTYTLETAGSEGFLNLLPVYLDHLLYPTLTDSAFTTEVYHITGEGQDAGVVYSEMQSRSSSAADKTFHTLVKELYPKPSGYRYDTGGSLINLRNETTNEKIRAYHKSFYRPENLQLLVMGRIDVETLLSVVQKYEDKIVKKGTRAPYTRPWLSPVPPITSTIHRDVVYPSNLEDNGKVIVAFRGPNMVQDYNSILTLGVLLDYLTYTSVSPMPTVFVDRDEPLASSVSSTCLQYKETSCYLQFSGVPLQSIKEIEPLLMSTLQDIYDEKTPIEISTVNDVLSKKILRIENRLENSPRSTIAYPVIDFGIYDTTCEHLDTRLNSIRWYRELLEKPKNFWRDLIKQYVLDAPQVILSARPSKEEAEKVAAEKKERVDRRKEALGVEGLKKMSEELEAAKKKNEIMPPPSMLNDMPIPSTKNVSYHPLNPFGNILKIDNVNTNFNQSPKGFNIKRFPFKFHVDDVKSNFVILSSIFDTSLLNVSQRLYLPLLMNLMFETNVIRNGTTEIPYTEVIKSLSRDFLVTKSQMTLSLGGSSTFSCGSFCNYATFTTKMEASKYDLGISWLYDVIYHSKFTVPRVKVKIFKMMNLISSSKRSGSSVLNLMNERLLFLKESNQNQVNFIRQEMFLKGLSSKLEDKEKASDVIKELHSVLDTLTGIQNVSFHMATDIQKLNGMTDINRPWDRFIPSEDKTKNLELNIVNDNEFRINSYPSACDLSVEKLRVNEHNSTSEADKNIIFLDVAPDSNSSIDCRKTAYVKGLSSEESSYLKISTAGINDYQHPDVPALIVGIKYFDQYEGPLWREIRGKGLAYSYGLSLIISEGTLSLSLIKASQLVNAYEETLKLLNGYINGSTEWDPTLLDTAKSSSLYGVIAREKTIVSSVQQSLNSYYKNTPHSYNKDLLPLISKLTVADVKKVVKKYFSALLSPADSTTVVVCPSDDVEKTKESLKGFGHEVEVIEDLEKSFFA